MDKLFITLYVLQLTAADKLAAKVAKVRNRESGQGALEYVGMIAVAAVIVGVLIVAGAIAVLVLRRLRRSRSD